MKSLTVLVLLAGMLGCGAPRTEEVAHLAALRGVRPRPTPARPVLRPIPGPVFNLDTAPDVDLRPQIASLNLPVRSQGSRGTCSVFAVTFLIEFGMAKNVGATMDLSEEFLNYAKNKATGVLTDGGFFDELDLGYETLGITTEAALPYRAAFEPNLGVRPAVLAAADGVQRLTFETIKAWDNTKGATDAQLASVMLALKFGEPVAVGMLWPNAGASFTTKFGVPMMDVPATRAEVFDGHSVDLVGFKKSALFPGGGYFIIRNSWGTGFGEGGYAYVPFAYLKAYANDLIYYHY